MCRGVLLSPRTTNHTINCTSCDKELDLTIKQSPTSYGVFEVTIEDIEVKKNE